MKAYSFKVLSYDKSSNDFEVMLLGNGEMVRFDPFVSCHLAIEDAEKIIGHAFTVEGEFHNSDCLLMSAWLTGDPPSSAEARKESE